MQPKLITKQNMFKTQVGQFLVATWTGTNESGWTPIGDKVLIYPDQCPEETAHGIKIPLETVARHTMAAEGGIVVELGPDATIPVKPGDRVFIERFGGSLCPGHDGKIYRIMDQSCIAAVFKVPQKAADKKWNGDME